MNFFTPAADLDALSQEIIPDPALPWALLIGDSISIGYTLPVRARLRGVCNLLRAPVNCGDTRNGLANLEVWLGDRHWDVIHFNWGLHDLCYRDPNSKEQGNRDKVNGRISVPLDAYRDNLRTLIDRLRPRARRLIWAATTWVPDGEVGRFVGDEIRFNAVAAELMREAGVPIHDLHALSASLPPELYLGPGNVHFTPEGSDRLAASVAARIREQLADL